jgi:hypothetical protein
MNRIPYGLTLTSTALVILGSVFLANCGDVHSKSTPAASTYSFYMTGIEHGSDGGPSHARPAKGDGWQFYALAGSVSIDSTGNVVGGEQDYNDGDILTSPEPAGDTITGGTLTADPTTGQGTLTLITNNTNLGVSGTETIGVQFANPNHALVVQFDDSATSSGSMDLQTLPSTLSGGYAFTVSGVDPDGDDIAFGGVFSVSGTSMENGSLDINDDGEVSLSTPFTGTMSTADSFGRGTITNTGIAATFVYYVVGAKAIRLIDVDTTDSGIGSAYAQGGGTFSNTSLGSSTFGIGSNSSDFLWVATGQFSVPSSGMFSGVVDVVEEGSLNLDVPVTGTVSVESNGHGILSIVTGDADDLANLGLYMTDPTLNLLDPNNTSTGLGGALVTTLDIVGTGTLISQTDTATASVTGNYAFGEQAFVIDSDPWEYDFIGQGSVTSGAFTGTAMLNDPGGFFQLDDGPNSGITFSATLASDADNLGRYTTQLNSACIGFSTVLYQSSGAQLFWMGVNSNDWSIGTLQQQGSLTGLPAIIRAAPKPTAKPQC